MPGPNALPAIHITYVGGPTAIVEIDGLRFLTDPTFDGPGKYTSGSIALEKTQGPVVPPDALGKIDIILLSHDQHADNLDPSGRSVVERFPTLTTEDGAHRLGGPALGMAPWESRELDAPSGRRLRVTATPARHGPFGIEKLSGSVIGFVIALVEPPRDLVYVTGDTVWFDGTAEVARRYSPAVVLLFAGAARTRGPFDLTMDTNDAVELAAAFPRSTIVPVHCAGWAHFTQSEADLVATFSVVGMSDRLRSATAGPIVVQPK